MKKESKLLGLLHEKGREGQHYLVFVKANAGYIPLAY